MNSRGNKHIPVEVSSSLEGEQRSMASLSEWTIYTVPRLSFLLFSSQRIQASHSVEINIYHILFKKISTDVFPQKDVKAV